jgi:hypothetical protein
MQFHHTAKLTNSLEIIGKFSVMILCNKDSIIKNVNPKAIVLIDVQHPFWLLAFFTINDY